MLLAFNDRRALSFTRKLRFIVGSAIIAWTLIIWSTCWIVGLAVGLIRRSFEAVVFAAGAPRSPTEMFMTRYGSPSACRISHAA